MTATGVVTRGDALAAGDPVEEARIRDAYARRGVDARYSWFAPGHQLMAFDAERRTLALLRRCGVTDLSSLDVLEVGCGAGRWIQRLVRWGATPARVAGVDLLPGRVEDARRVCAPGVTLGAASATALPFPDQSFDVVLQATMLTSVLNPGVRAAAAAEMRRVLRPGGFVLWYDFRVNNPRNPDVRGIRRREIAALFPAWRLHLRRATLAPPLARALAPRAWPLAALLTEVPWLCTHYVGVLGPAGIARGGR